MDPRPDETAASVASRLAARNGTTLQGFCLDMQIPLHAVHDGRTTAVRVLAELTGKDPDAFAGSMLTRHGDVQGRDWTYHGQRLRTENLTRSCRRVCPLCLAEDVTASDLKPAESAYARCAWRIRHLRTCMVHEVALVELDEEVDRYSTYDTAQVYRGLLRRLPDACRDTTLRAPSSFERYLLLRLEAGAGGVGWLDAKPMWAAAQMVEHVGTAVLFGRSPNLHRLDDDDWWEAGKVGFETLQEGAGGVKPVLDQLHDTFDFARTGRDAPGRIYGQMWRWVEGVATGPEFDDVRDVMREHALSRLPLAAGTEVLGRTLEKRRVHSLRSLHVETGRHQARLRKILGSHGLLPAGHEVMNPNRLTFDVEKVAPLLAGVVGTMATSEVLEYLGVSRVQALVSEGILRPIPVSGERTGKHEFARGDVENLMAELWRDAEALDALGPDQVDLLTACRVAARHLTELIALIRERRLTKVWRLSDGKGFRSVVVSRSGLKPHKSKTSSGMPRSDALAMYQVIKRLGVGHAAAYQLVKNEVLVSTTLPSPRGGKLGRYVAEADITKFQERFVTLTEMARKRKMNVGNVKKEMLARGIEPALRPEDYTTGFYLRSDI